jgi:hypothetical protein
MPLQFLRSRSRSLTLKVEHVFMTVRTPPGPQAVTARVPHVARVEALNKSKLLGGDGVHEAAQ